MRNEPLTSERSKTTARNIATAKDFSMTMKTDTGLVVLVVEDVRETRDGIEKLLATDGYHVTVAKDERSAIESARLKHPDLILVSLSGLEPDVIVSARSIRKRAGLGENVPVVIFCSEEVAEGEEVEVSQNVHVTRPDNFNQLRSLITRLLRLIPKPPERKQAIAAGESL